VAVDWRGFAAAEQRRRVPLPSYPFERRRFWVEPGQLSAVAEAETALRKLSDPKDWLYLPSWRQVGPPLPDTGAPAGRWLVFEDDAGLGAALARRLVETGASVQRVVAGAGFSARGEGVWVIDPSSDTDHEHLFDALAAGPGLPDGIVHLMGTAVEAGAGRADPSPFWGPLWTVRGIGRRLAGKALRLVFVTRGAQAVLPGDTVEPGLALVAGPALVAAREYPSFDVRWIDVSGAGADTVRHLAAECQAQPAAGPLAWRGRQRWQRGHEPLPLPAVSGPLAQLTAGAAVVITGGLGGIGLVLARGLALALPGVRLLLISRSGLPSQPVDDRGRRRCAAVQALRDAGAQVMVAAADVADRDALAAALDQGRARFGRFNGVLHCAGLPAGGVIELKTRAAAEAILAPKVHGTCLLDELLATDAPDFFLLCSSLTASLGSAGQVDYTAANAFQDAFAQARSLRAPGLTVSVQWDSWAESGMALEAELPPALAELRRQGLATGLTDGEGIDVFRRVLSAGQAQVLVSTRDLQHRLHPAPPSRSPMLAATGESAAAVPTGALRRMLSTPYVEPRNEVERVVAAAWQDLFGIQVMGVNDNFFEADGHSLLAIQIVARLAKDIGVKLPVNAMFESPTIAQIAERIAAASAQSTDDERELADALAMVELLTDEEVARLLDDGGKGP
jgi:NAD(P)-dependent dehydrogenase (short-subunit alcohol dehydrogenase family)/acyl carrier protein